jgi:hypothetical protein
VRRTRVSPTTTSGHLPPALLVGDGPTQPIPAAIGPPLGTGVGGHEQIFVDLLPDRILLIYPDGPVKRLDRRRCGLSS